MLQVSIIALFILGMIAILGWAIKGASYVLRMLRKSATMEDAENIDKEDGDNE